MPETSLKIQAVVLVSNSHVQKKLKNTKKAGSRRKSCS